MPKIRNIQETRQIIVSARNYAKYKLSESLDREIDYWQGQFDLATHLLNVILGVKNNAKI